MDRKKFIAVAISAALGLSGAPVYASESAAFSDGEVQEYGAEEEKQEFQLKTNPSFFIMALSPSELSPASTLFMASSRPIWPSSAHFITVSAQCPKDTTGLLV